MLLMKRVRSRNNRMFASAILLGSFLMVLALDATATPVQYSKSRLVAKLASQPGDAQKRTLGATGNAALDAVLSADGVDHVRQLVPVLSRSSAKSTDPLRKRLTEYLRIDVPAGVDPDALKNRIAAVPGIESVEFDIIVTIDGASVTPNDPYFNSFQYPLRNTGSQPPADPGTAGADASMEEAWAFSTGDENVILAIIDTGIDYDHPDLMNRIWYNLDEGTDGIDEDANGYASDWRGWNFVSNNPNADDDHSHGSHCAGIAGAEANNSIGIAGMDWNCKLMACKALNSSGSGFSSDIAEAIVYAADNGASIISMSLGAYGSSGDEQAAIDYAHDVKGVTIFAAMGNDNVSTPHYPAAFPKVIAVGATDSDDRRALPLCGSPGSNYGDYIDICAAGNWVWSTVPLENGSYGYKCGTSMATPHAAGLGALIKSLRPNFTPEEVRHLMQMAADDQVGRPTEDTPGYDIYHGWGRINGRATLQALALEFPPMLTVPAAQVVTELDTLEFVVSAEDSNFTYPVLSAGALTNATFVDSGNGIGVLTFTPDILQQGVYNIQFVADDGTFADTADVQITVEDGCLCPMQSDFDDDGFLTALDLNQLIEILFFAGTDIQDPGCPMTRSDFDCDLFPTALDLNDLISHLFFGGDGPCDPCAP